MLLTVFFAVMFPDLIRQFPDCRLAYRRQMPMSRPIIPLKQIYFVNLFVNML